MRNGLEVTHVLAVTALSLLSAVASAQTPDARSAAAMTALQAQVPVGGLVYVTDTTGATIKGTLVAMIGDALQVQGKAGVQRIAVADVRRIQWAQPDSAWTGVLIGGAIGAIPGLYYLAVDPNECTGMCPEEYALIAIGAAVGGVIDRAMTRRVTVYSAPAASSTRVTLAPLILRGRTGVQVALRF